jgi:hypothetical protein
VVAVLASADQLTVSRATLGGGYEGQYFAVRPGVGRHDGRAHGSDTVLQKPAAEAFHICGGQVRQREVDAEAAVVLDVDQTRRNNVTCQRAGTSRSAGGP